MSTHQSISHSAFGKCQLARELPATEVACLLDIPVSEVAQKDKVVQKQRSSTAQTLGQVGLYRPPLEKLLKPTKATVQVNDASPACQLSPGQELVQTLQQGLVMSASPTCG